MTRTLVLLPGLGADSRLFDSQRAVVSELQVPSWPEPEPGQTLPAFAARLADSVPRSEQLFLGGSSFGGMVALELAALLKPQGVFLIGSCTTPSSIAPFARRLHPLVSALPVDAFRLRRWEMPIVLSAFGRLTSHQRELFWSMASVARPSFVKWGLGAILSWNPTPAGVPVYHVHGSGDRLIPLRLVRPQRVVPGAGHLLTLTHPQYVNEFLLQVLAEAA